MREENPLSVCYEQLVNVLLYYLSTVPQTLAAAFAFATAFATYSLPRLGRKRDEAADNIADLMKGWKEVKRLRLKRLWNRFIDEVDKHCPSEPDNRTNTSKLSEQDRQAVRKLRNDIVNYRADAKKLLALLKWGMILTVVCISLSLAFLFLADYIARSEALAWLICAPVWVLCVIILIIVFKIMFLVAISTDVADRRAKVADDEGSK